MKKIAGILLGLMPFASFAESDAIIELRNAINVSRTNCSGISARMEKIKKMAGIGTAVNAVGAATGVGGVASGVAKYYKDVEVWKDVANKSEIDDILEQLKDREKLKTNQDLLNEAKSVSPYLQQNLDKLLAETDTKQQKKDTAALKQESERLGKEISKNQQKSTALGNVRTGLFAADTATNVAGAIISSQTVTDDDFMANIQKCVSTMDILRNAITRVRVEDGVNADPQQMETGQKILNKCGEYFYLDLAKLNKLGKGAMITNSIGAATGVAATITSAVGNNTTATGVVDKAVAAESQDKAVQEVKKYIGINVASNVMGGVTAAASVTGAVLNASQIKTAKQALNIAQECEEALQW